MIPSRPAAETLLVILSPHNTHYRLAVRHGAASIPSDFGSAHLPEQLSSATCAQGVFVRAVLP